MLVKLVTFQFLCNAVDRANQQAMEATDTNPTSYKTTNWIFVDFLAERKARVYKMKLTISEIGISEVKRIKIKNNNLFSFYFTKNHSNL